MGSEESGWVCLQFDTSFVYPHSVNVCVDQLLEHGDSPWCLFSNSKEMDRNQTSNIGTGRVTF